VGYSMIFQTIINKIEEWWIRQISLYQIDN
jgi:hypothetical protein